jgi:hypothetical protein
MMDVASILGEVDARQALPFGTAFVVAVGHRPARKCRDTIPELDIEFRT